MEKTGGNKMVITQNEIKWSSIALSEVIERGLRFEASVFDVEGKRAKEIVCNCDCEKKTITGNNGIATAYTCGRFKRIWVERSELPIFQPSSILDLYPKPDGYLSGKTNTDVDKLRVHKGQVLITCSGTIGKVGFVSETLDNKIYSHDLLRVTCNDISDAGYLYAFVKSDIGNLILTTNQYGAVISHIEAGHLDEVVLPYPDKKIRTEIGDKIEASFQLRDEANQIWEQATEIIYRELNLEPLSEFKRRVTGKDLKSFSVKLSSLSGRMDASFHDSVVSAIMDKIAEEGEKIVLLGSKEISEDIYLPPRFKRVYVSKGHGIKMFGIKQITTLDPFTEKYLALGCVNKECRNKLLLKPGTILISRSGTIGNMCMVPPHWKNWIASEDLIRVRVKREIEGYVYCFLLSDYGQALIKRFAFGAVQDHIDCEQVATLPIPLLKNRKRMEEINNLIEIVNQKRNDAYVLEQEAMKIMNTKVYKI